MSLCAGVHLPGSVRPRGRPLTAGVTAQPWPRAPAAGSAGWRMSHAALGRHGQDVVVAGRPRSPPSGRTDPPGGIMTSSITPLRISPGVPPDTPPSIATGHSRSKFGLPAGATATDRLIERMLTRGCVRLRGIHMHLGSQIRDLRVYDTAVRTVAHYLRASDLPELCVGSGLAIA